MSETETGGGSEAKRGIVGGARRFRLLALDIDGTVLNREGRLLPTTARAVRAAEAAGIRPVLCTGRRHRKATPVAEELGLESPLVCNSGGIVKSRCGSKTHWRADLDAELARGILAILDRFGQPAISFADTAPDGHDFVVEADPTGNPLLDEYLELNRPHGRVVPDWRARLEGESHFHLCAFGTREAMLELERAVLEAFGGVAQTFVQKSPNYSGHSCEILRGDANKWTALGWLARSWGIPAEEICAIGDDMNDVQMIAGAGLGVAMGHAPADVLRVADHVTGSHDEDGVTRFIEEVLLPNAG